MTDDTDIDGLAGEYVLGALPPAERAAIAARLATEPALAAAVADWERRLAPLAWQAPGVDPNPRVLGDIIATVAQVTVTSGRAAGAPTAEIIGLRRRARTWQWVASGLAASLAAVAVGLGVSGRISVGDGGRTEVAALASLPGSTAADDAPGGVVAAFVATHDREQRRLTVRQIAGRPAAAGRAFVVWMELDRGTAPRLLGVLQRSDGPTLLDVAMTPAETANARLIVSVEHDRATPMDKPRGPIVSAGQLGRP